MAASTANQKVFVPLSGVLALQDTVRNAERVIADTQDSTLRATWIARYNELRRAIQTLELPIECEKKFYKF